MIFASSLPPPPQPEATAQKIPTSAIREPTATYWVRGSLIAALGTRQRRGRRSSTVRVAYELAEMGDVTPGDDAGVPEREGSPLPPARPPASADHPLGHQSGVVARELAERAGHSKPSMSLDVYSHVMPAAEVASERFLSLLMNEGT